MLTCLDVNQIGLPTFEAQVIPAPPSIAGRALGTGAPVLVRSLADPVTPAGVDSGQLDSGGNESSVKPRWAYGFVITLIFFVHGQH